MSFESQKASFFIETLWHEGEGAYRFTRSQPPSVMATAYCVLALEALGEQAPIRSRAKKISAFIRRGEQADGTFLDPMHVSQPQAGSAHDEAYFLEETTAFCRQTLDALGEKSSPRDIPFPMERWSWSDPWLDANRAHFYLSQIAMDAIRLELSERWAKLDEALAWLEKRHDPQTGLWKVSPPVSPTFAMAATCHFGAFWMFRRNSLPYAERLIDSCLRLQQRDGLFSGYSVGHSCWDYDALDLLSAASQTTPHRRADVERALSRARTALANLQNADGGFPHTRWNKKMIRGFALPAALNRPARGIFQGGRQTLSGSECASNAYTTWFRLLALRASGAEGFKGNGRPLPFLGWRPSKSA